MWFKLLSLVCLVLAILIGYISYSDTIEPIDFNNIVYKMGGTHKAFVLGGSGGIGRSIVKALASTPEFEKVTLIGRRIIELPASDPESNYDKFDQKIMDFEKISESIDLFKGYDVGFYALGVSSALVSEAEYKKIELHNALAIAKGIYDAGDCQNLHWITGNGVSKTSLFLFGRIKAQVEEETTKMEFRRLAFYRPAKVLLPENPGIVGKVFKTLGGECMSVDADLMGRVIVANSLRETDQKVEIFVNMDINKFGKKLQEQSI